MMKDQAHIEELEAQLADLEEPRETNAAVLEFQRQSIEASLRSYRPNYDLSAAECERLRDEIQRIAEDMKDLEASGDGVRRQKKLILGLQSLLAEAEAMATRPSRVRLFVTRYGSAALGGAHRRRAPLAQVNDTLGAVRSAVLSSSKSVAGVKPAMLATITSGNCSRLVL